MLHQPRGVANTVPIRTTISTELITGNHGEMFSAPSAWHNRYSPRRVFANLLIRSKLKLRVVVKRRMKSCYGDLSFWSRIMWMRRLKWKNDSNGVIVMATRSSLMRPINNNQNSIDKETVGVFIIRRVEHCLFTFSHLSQSSDTKKQSHGSGWEMKMKLYPWFGFLSRFMWFE